MNPQQLGSHLRCQMSAGGESRRSFPKTGMADFGKGFGCRPGASGIPGKRAGVRKPPKNEPAEKR